MISNRLDGVHPRTIAAGREEKIFFSSLVVYPLRMPTYLFHARALGRVGDDERLRLGRVRQMALVPSCRVLSARPLLRSGVGNTLFRTVCVRALSVLGAGDKCVDLGEVYPRYAIACQRARVPEFRPWMRELLSEIRPTEHDVCYRPGRVEHTIWLTSGPYQLRIIIILFADAL